MNARFQPERDRCSSQVAVQFLKFKIALFVWLCALPLYGVVMIGVGGGSWMPLAVYPLMSVIAFGLYGYDKRQAKAQGQRTPEKVLHAAELLGGWPGALVAQQVYRHKTRKLSYQCVFWAIVLLHQLFWIDRLFMGGHFLTRHFF